MSEPFYELDDHGARFEADHPGIQVQVTYRQQIADDWPRHFDGALISGTPVETDLWLDLTRAQAAWQWIAYPIGDVGEVSASLTNHDFFQGALEAASWKGQLIGVPVAVRPLALYYDAKAMEELGIPRSSDHESGRRTRIGFGPAQPTGLTRAPGSDRP